MVTGCRNILWAHSCQSELLQLMVLLWSTCLLSAFHLACCAPFCVSGYQNCALHVMLFVLSFTFPSSHILCDLKCYTDMNLISVIPVREEKCSHLLSQFALPVLGNGGRKEQFNLSEKYFQVAILLAMKWHWYMMWILCDEIWLV